MAMEMLNDVMTSTYLARIGWEGDASVTRKTLDGLVYAHQCSVPFETADLVALGETPSLEMGDLYQKIVVDRHGGFCFELNKMFELLLRSVGFEVRPCLSRAVRGREGRMPINHRGTLVSLDGELLLVDVGFGGPLPAGSLAICDEREQTIRGEVYIPRPSTNTGGLSIGFRRRSATYTATRARRGVRPSLSSALPLSRILILLR